MPARPQPQTRRVTLSIADAADRRQIYRLRHDVYALELGQHPENPDGELTDRLDDYNVYLVAKRGDSVVGFIAVTPPGPHGYSIDKYFSRDTLPFESGDTLFEVRLLTVVGQARRTALAALLMYAAFRYVDAHQGERIVAIGRHELLPLYERAGLLPHRRLTQAGAVTYELMSAPVAALREHMAQFAALIARFGVSVEWQLPFPAECAPAACTHGGAFWSGIGPGFERLDRAADIISADVLDAWFDPAPAALEAVADHLPFLMKTSPPTGSEGLRAAIALARGIGEQSILPGAGSSELMFSALRHWLTPLSRVLVLDPMYGEYVHLAEHIIGARVERLDLRRHLGYEIDDEELAWRLNAGYDWVFIVNPNSPTGRFVAGDRLERIIEGAPANTRFWIDETYIDYVGRRHSLESLAARSTRVVVVKSLSKAYALSGLRVAYACAAPNVVSELRRWSPPWAVSLPGQVAACTALSETEYYEARWRDTAALRSALGADLSNAGWHVIPGCANFLMCHTPAGSRPATDLVQLLQSRRLFIRDLTAPDGRLSDAVRIAVKDAGTNRRIVDTLAQVLDRSSYVGG